MQSNGSYGNREVPLEFGLALANDVSAMIRFSDLSPRARESVIDRAMQATSREEMQNIVASLRADMY